MRYIEQRSALAAEETTAFHVGRVTSKTRWKNSCAVSVTENTIPDRGFLEVRRRRQRKVH